MSDQALREHLLYLLRGGGAHAHFDQVIKGVPEGIVGTRPTGMPYTLWSVLEHLRISQWDILEFSRNAEHVSPEFPNGYWPESESPPHEGAWDECVAAFRADLRAMEDLVADPATDLYAHIPHGDGQTILREALLVADHNAYHLGQLLLMRRALGEWEDR
jgi:hypothetical protein